MLCFCYKRMQGDHSNSSLTALLVSSVKENLENKRCAYSHENYDFGTTTASMLKLSFDLKGYGVKNPMMRMHMPTPSLQQRISLGENLLTKMVYYTTL